MTKIHELLGVGVDEEFKVKDHKFIYKLDESGVLMKLESGYWYQSPMYTFAALINNPSLIIRKSRLTGEQRKVLEALYTLGFKWVAKEKDGSIFAYDEDPVKNSHGWYGSGYEFYCERIALLAPLLPDWTVPLDIEKTLKEAQQ